MYVIIHRLTCPRTSKQNGVVERKHRHMVDSSLSLLAHAFMPLTFWKDEFSTAVHLINRLSTHVLGGEVPVNRFYDCDPDYTFLPVFGCQCFPCLIPFNSHKLQF